MCRHCNIYMYRNSTNSSIDRLKITVVILFCFNLYFILYCICLWITPSSPWRLLLALCLVGTLGSSQDHMMPGIEPKPPACKLGTQPVELYLCSVFNHLITSESQLSRVHRVLFDI